MNVLLIHIRDRNMSYQHLMTSANTKKQVKFLGLFLPGLIFSDFENSRRMRGLNERLVKLTPP